MFQKMFELYILAYALIPEHNIPGQCLSDKCIYEQSFNNHSLYNFLSSFKHSLFGDEKYNCDGND